MSLVERDHVLTYAGEPVLAAVDHAGNEPTGKPITAYHVVAVIPEGMRASVRERAEEHIRAELDQVSAVLGAEPPEEMIEEMLDQVSLSRVPSGVMLVGWN